MTIRGQWALGAMLLATLLPQLSRPSSAEDRALLVGLSRYGDPMVSPTPGGTEDARAVARVLTRKFSFPEENIRLLLDEQATAVGILQSFEEWLIEGTRPGDRVFFLYAGHGSQLPDENRDEDDGFDETLAPYDVDPVTGEHQILDDVIDSLIARLSGRRVVLLFDSCHSGTLTRSAAGAGTTVAGVRYLPRPDQIRQFSRRRGQEVSGGTYRIEAVSQGEQNFFDGPDEDERSNGVVAISAAGPGQLAYPIEVLGASRGALSYLFEQAFTSSSRGGFFGDLPGALLQSAPPLVLGVAESAVQGGDSEERLKGGLKDLQQEMTIATLGIVLGTGMKTLQESGRLPGDQSPWLEVVSEGAIDQQTLWGDHNVAAAVAMTPPFGGRQVELRTADDRVWFGRGEEISFEVRTDRPGYLYLLVFSEQERATCLFPNPSDRANRIDRGVLHIPTHESYQLPAQAPFGRDLAVAIVADAPLPLCEKIDYRWSEVFDRIRLDEIHRRLEARRKTRGIGYQATSLETDEPATGLTEWQTATFVLQTSESIPYR